MNERITKHFPGFLPGNWDVDPNGSRVSFELHYAYARAAEGYFQRLRGTMDISSDPDFSIVELTLDAASITSGNSERDRHLRSPAFLDVVTYPYISLHSSGIRRVDGHVVLDCALSIRSESHPLSLDVHSLTSSSLNDDDGNSVGFSATSTVYSRAFGLPSSTDIERSNVLALPDRLTLRFELAALTGREQPHSGDASGPLLPIVD